LPFFYQFMVPDLLRENLRNKMWDVRIWARLHALMHKKHGVYRKKMMRTTHQYHKTTSKFSLLAPSLDQLRQKKTTITFFPRSWFTRFLKRATRHVPIVEQELLTLPVFLFSFGHCVVYPLIYHYWLLPLVA